MAQLDFVELSITNFRSYNKTQKIRFEGAGLYFVEGSSDGLGSNGAGKSSILDALTWCLYGKTLRDERPGDSVEPWLGSNKVEVVLSFRRGRGRYKVKRTRHPNKLCVIAGLDGDWEEYSQEQVEALFGLGYDAFRCTIVSPQFGPWFLDMRSEEQARLFADTLDLDRYDRAASKASKLAGSVETELCEAETALASATGRLEEIDEQSDEAEAAHMAWIEEHAKIGGAMEIERRKIEEKLAKLAREKRDPKSLPVGTPTEEDLRKGEKVVQTLSDSLTALEGEVREAKFEMRTLHSKVEDLEEDEKQFSKDPETCPTCGGKVKKDHFKKCLADIRLALKSANDRLRKVLGIIAKGEREIARLTEQISLKQSAIETGRLKWQQAVLALSADNEEIERLNIRRGDLRLQLKQREKMVSPHLPTIKSLEERRRKLIKQKRDLKGEVLELQAVKESYGFWATAFKQIRLDLVDRVLAELALSTTRYVEALGLEGWRIEFVTERELKGGAVSRGFSAMLYPPNAGKPVRWEAYCGGEAQRWQIAVRFALSEVLLAHAGLSTNFEALDEPTHGLTAEAVSTLIDSLRDRAKELGRKILFIDHHEINAEFDGTLSICKGSSGSVIRAV